MSKKVLAVLLGVLLSMSTVAPFALAETVLGENVLVNGGFEDLLESWTTYDESVAGFAAADVVAITEEAETFTEGAAAATITRAEETLEEEKRVYLYQRVPSLEFEEGKKYRLSADIYIPDNDYRFVMSAKAGTFDSVDLTYSRFFLSGDVRAENEAFTTYTCDFVYGKDNGCILEEEGEEPECKDIYVVFSFWTAAGTVYIDNVALQEVVSEDLPEVPEEDEDEPVEEPIQPDAEGNLLINGNFEIPPSPTPLYSTGWTIIPFYASSSTTSIKNDTHSGGKYVMQLSGKAGEEVRDYVTQTIPADKFEDGANYIVNADINIGVANQAFIGITRGRYDSAQDVWYERLWEHTTDGWCHLSGMFTYDDEWGDLTFHASGWHDAAPAAPAALMMLDNVSVVKARDGLITRVNYDRIAPNFLTGQKPSGTDTEIVQDNGNYCVKILRDSTPYISYIPYTAAVEVGDGTPITIKARVKMVDAEPNLRQLFFWTGPSAGATSDLYYTLAFDVPAAYDNQWVELEANFINVGANLNLPGICVKNRATFLIDDIEMYIDNETKVVKGKVIDEASQVIWEGYEAYPATGRITVPVESYASTETISKAVRFYPTETEANALAVSAIYAEKGGVRQIVKIDYSQIEGTLATESAPAKFADATLTLSTEGIDFDPEATYTVETILWEGASLMPAFAGKKVVTPITIAVEAE